MSGGSLEATLDRAGSRVSPPTSSLDGYGTSPQQPRANASGQSLRAAMVKEGAV
jgi:hypothetical protein